MPDEKLNAALAANFRANGNNFKPFLRTMFRCEEFYSPDIVRNEVKSPVQWLVGSVRMLECALPPPLVSYAMLRQLGQDLFAPPNVKGWDGGVTWITTNTLLTRYNDAQSLVQGTLPQLERGRFRKKGRWRRRWKSHQSVARHAHGRREPGKDFAAGRTHRQSHHHRLAAKTPVPDLAQYRPAAGFAGISRLKNQNVRCRHPHSHPPDDVHAGLSSKLTYEKRN
jgi:hypothetical protein